MKVNIGKYPKKGERRIKIQIEKHDTWSLDHSLALIIYPCLVQLKETKHGVPHDFSEVGGADYEQQQSFDFYKDTTGELFEQKSKMWDETLDKMIWSFSQIIDDEWESKYHHGEPKYDWVETEETMLNPVTGVHEKLWQMVDKNPDEHWYDSVGHRLHEERIQEGLNLFGKYFRNLWD